MTKRQKKRGMRARGVLKAIAGRNSPGNVPYVCGKVCYPSKQQAKSAVRRSIGCGSMVHKELMGGYWCGRCHAWHIGHRWLALRSEPNAELS